MTITAVLIIVWFIILAFTIWHYKNDKLYISRTKTWYIDQWKQAIEAKRASLFDFSSFAAAVLSILGLIVGWYTISQQNIKSALDQNARDLGEQVSAHKHRLDQLRESEMRSGINQRIRLGLPGRDAQVVGSHVDISWSSSGHNPEATYLVQVISKDQNVRSDVREEGCRNRVVIADDSADQETQLRGTDVCPLRGKYLWRVAPRSLYEQPDRLSPFVLAEDWSEYGSFEIYPTMQDRVLVTHVALVGTTYTDDEHFSGRDENGRPRGHDIDLIELLVRGCLKNAEGGTAFDQMQCDSSIDIYKRGITASDGRYLYKTGAEQLDIHVVPFESVEEGLRALSRREIDVFVGSVTKAKRRERGQIFFSRGYFNFHSDLYVRGPSQYTEPFDQWSTHKQNIGVISNSTNHWLGTQLTTEGGGNNRITLVAFENFLGLEKAFEDGEVDGAIVDCMLAPRLVDAMPLGDLQDTNAWTAYLNDNDNLGYGIEQLGIAMVREASQKQSSDRDVLNGLQRGIEQALDYTLSKPELVYALRYRNHILTTMPNGCVLKPG